MRKINYEDLQDIDIKATNKLLIYIDSSMDISKLYQDTNKNFNFFRDESSRLAFNSWLTMDYVTEEGVRFIESFLNKIPSNLNQLERIILRGKSNSHISLLEIKKIYGEYIIVKDILNNLDYKLWEPKLKGLMKEGEIFLARIGKALDNYRFIGDVNYLPLSVKPVFMENLLIDFNTIRKDNPLMDIKRYLKTNTLNVYKVYEESILNVKDVEYDEDYLLFFQLEEYESYLSSKTNHMNIRNHINNLMNIYEYKLEDEDMTIKDIANLDLDMFFRESIEDDFIFTKEEFNSYVDTFKSYLGFLSSIEKENKDAYREILNISQNRFKYTQDMLSHSRLFKLDQDLVKIVGKFLDNNMINLLKDLDSFLTMVDEENPKLTKKNKFISRNDLYYINENLRLEYNPNSKAPNQKDYPLIDLFYFVSISLDLCEIIEDRLYLKEKANYYLRLKDEEKYALLCSYVLDGRFIQEKFPQEDIQLLDRSFTSYKDFIFRLSSLKDPLTLIQQLKLMNILKGKINPNVQLQGTSFGKTLVNYLIEKNTLDKKSNIVYFENLKSSNYKL